MKRSLLKSLIKEIVEENNAQKYDYHVKFTIDMHDEKGRPIEKMFDQHLKFTDMYQALDYVTNTPHVLAPNQKILKISIEQSSWGTHHHKTWEEE